MEKHRQLRDKRKEKRQRAIERQRHRKRQGDSDSDIGREGDGQRKQRWRQERNKGRTDTQETWESRKEVPVEMGGSGDHGVPGETYVYWQETVLAPGC